MRFIRSWTESLPNNGGPDVFPISLQLPDSASHPKVRAWISNFGSSNVHLIRGQVNLVQAQDLLARGLSDVLMTLPSSGPGEVPLPIGEGSLTIFFEAVNTSGQFQAVTIVVYE